MTSYDPPPTAPGYHTPAVVSTSGLTEAEASDFHRLFLMAFAVFTLIAILAHVAAWAWRPWGHQTSPSQARMPVAAVSTLNPVLG
jgi:hypothetical protein